MRLSLDMLTTLALIGAVQLALIGAAFGVSRSAAHRFFAAFAFAMAMLMFGSVVHRTELVHQFPHLAYIHAPTNFLLGPLFYLFVATLLHASTPRRLWVHGLPALACALTLLPFYAMSGAEKLAGLDTATRLSSIRTWVLLVQCSIYVAATFIVLHRGDRERRRRFLWIGTSALALMAIAGVVRILAEGSPMWVPAAITVAATAMSILMIRPSMIPGTTVRKYAHSTLTEDRCERYMAKLVDLFEREKPFLDPVLSLEVLAQRLSIPPSHLSQIVNERLGSSFREWLKRWRIEEAKRILVSPKSAHLSVVAIGEAAGFRSKSAFHAAFRKETSMTPTEFRRRSSA